MKVHRIFKLPFFQDLCFVYFGVAVYTGLTVCINRTTILLLFILTMFAFLLILKLKINCGKNYVQFAMKLFF